MKPTLQAILARFSGNRDKARLYCIALATEYKQLAPEYWEYAAYFTEKAATA